MRKLETWLMSLLLPALALLLPMAVLEPVSLATARAGNGILALGACDDGSAHLAMGCASIAL